ncbi:MAG: GguC protein, partial [Verrucomicrobiales bacterium]|nr:GguC protein [Verrucomicrobiales bacterium]
AELSDSMKMYFWGVEGGRPAKGKIGVQPEWFYKGHGNILCAHGEALDVPAFGDDGGDEAEIAGVYLVDPKGTPHRIGLVQGNEFSDHIMEQKNYLYLAHSKLRACALGPELIVGADFSDVQGKASVERKGKTIWSHDIHTGDRNMSHTLANLEHHHFKYASHCVPGDTHIHFFGADAFSFGQGLKLQTGDVMEIEFAGFGRALRNPLRIDKSKSRFVGLKQL